MENSIDSRAKTASFLDFEIQELDAFFAWIDCQWMNWMNMNTRWHVHNMVCKNNNDKNKNAFVCECFFVYWLKVWGWKVWRDALKRISNILCVRKKHASICLCVCVNSKMWFEQFRSLVVLFSYSNWISKWAHD